MNRLLNFRSRFFWGVVLPLAAIFCLAPIRLSWAQRRTARPAPQPAGPASPAESAPRFKAVWEPVNYNQDLQLFDVFFVTPDEGWVSGAKGTILHTTDGGKTWTAQLGGDLQSQGPDLKRVFFLDKTHGWAQSWSQLFRTTDGENWQEVGNDVRGYALFVSPQKGFRVYGGRLYATQDGGANWKEVFSCHVQGVVEGLTREIDCDIYSLQFISPLVGYGGGSSDVLVKTTDGGNTWQAGMISLPPGDSRIFDVFFLDDNRGFVERTQWYRTTDGGASWQGVIGPAQWGMGGGPIFADPGVGWSCWGNRLTYTTDGGAHWLSRDFRFPAAVSRFSLPRRDRAYVVGEHGMVYRYRIVPIDYKVANMVDAPMMPGLTTQLDGTVANIREKAKALQAKLEAAQTKPTGSARPAQSELASYSGAADGGEQEAPTPPSGEAQAPGGFVQDVGNDPPSPPIQECCAAEVQGLQTGVGSFLQQVPAFSSSWRPLNLIIAGLRLASDLLNKAQGVRSNFLALKTAKSLPEASAALQTMMTNLDGASQTIASRFQNTASITWPETAEGAASAVAGALAPSAGQPAAAPSATPATGTAQGAKPDDTKKTNPTAEDVKKKLKKKFGVKFP